VKRRDLLSWKVFLGEVEIWALLILCAIWFFLNLDGALDVDEFLKTSGTRFLLFGGPVANLNHPPLGKIFIGIGYVFFGKTSVGWRVVTPFFALGTIYLTYRIGVLLKSRATGFLAAVALAFTYLFASHAVMAMLDVYLAFFIVLLLFFILSYFRKMEFLSTKGEKLYLLCMGAASCSVFLSKYYGLFFVGAAYLVLLWRWRRESITAEGKERLSILNRHKFFLIGHAVVALLAYLPILLRIQDVIEYSGTTGGTGGFVTEVTVGNRIIVAGTVYDGAPIWSHLYWLWEHGGWFYLLGLLVLLYVLYVGVRRRQLSWGNKAMLFLSLIPLISLSFLPVKFPRYLIPLFPILGLFAALAICGGMEFLLRRILGRRKRRLSKRALKILSTGLALSVLFLPYSPIYTTIQGPRINTDTGYDTAATIVYEYAQENSNRTVLVYGWYGGILGYYLEDSHPDNLIIENLDYLIVEYDVFRNLSVDLVVDLEHQPRFDDMPTFIFIHENYVSKRQVKGDLYVYYMN
jgi:4-amino-4-deoxy-L-arabinose transferase-like glycosyltransferase